MRLCPKCDSEYEDDVDFCMGCGGPLTAMPEGYSRQSQKEFQQDSWWQKVEDSRVPHSNKPLGWQSNVDISKMTLSESIGIAWRSAWTGQAVNTIPNLNATSVKAANVASEAHKQYLDEFLFPFVTRGETFSFPTVNNVSFMPKTNEKVYSALRGVYLNETRSVRSSRSIRGGGMSRGESTSHYEMTHIAIGDLYVTNQRIYFVSGQVIRNVALRDVSSFDSNWSFSNGIISVTSERRTKVMQFEGGDAFRATAAFWYLKDGQFRALLCRAKDNPEVVKNILLNTALAGAKKEFDEVRDRQNEANANADLDMMSGCITILIFFLILAGVLIYGFTH